MTRVCVDGTVFENDVQRGIRRIYWEVMSRTAAAADRTVDYWLWLRRPAVGPVPAGVRVVRDRGRTSPGRRNLPARALARWARRRPPPAVRDAAVVHASYFTPRPCDGPAFVVSVYDLVAELAFGYAGGELWAGHMATKAAAIRSATLLLAISQATAADLARLYPEVADRVRVVPLGADHLGPPTADDAGGDGDDQFALFVGERDGYKNFQVVLEAVTGPGWPAGLALAVVGRPLAEHEWRLIDAMGVRSRIRDHGRVADADLRRLYATARCFVFPSRLEGFGLPLLEAQVNRCPIVCSDIPVFHEVAGPAAVYFDPRLGERLAAAVAAACEPDVRQRLVDAGVANVGRFSWDRTAAGYAAAYAEAARAVGR